MKILCVIPSRMASTRLPRKALALIQGKPMVQWVFEHARECALFDRVIVATDSDEIAAVIDGCGGEVFMTDPKLPTGSDRVAAVAKNYEDMDIVINLQGDEPFIQANMLEALVNPYLQGETPEMTTLARPMLDNKLQQDPGIVKVIIDINGYALYFSRSPIPYMREPIEVPVYHHLGIYAFRADFLQQFTRLPQTPLEKAEALEQLRALEHGYRIRVCETTYQTLEINTPEELTLAQNFPHTHHESVFRKI